MLLPVRKNLFRWETPWPVSNLMLVGHLILKEKKCILIDPPYVPGIVESIKCLTTETVIILTSQNHTRGSKYLASETGAKIYIPEQNPEAIEPQELLSVRDIGNYESYSEGEVLGMKIFQDFEDKALLTEEKELIVSDNARGTEDGKLVLWPECNPHNPPYPPNKIIHKQFRKLIEESEAVSLLAGHGKDIIRNLQDQSKNL